MERDNRIFDLWLASYTQQEIAELVGVPKQTISDKISGLTDFGKVAKSGQIAAEHLTDFDPPLYDIWKQQEIADVAGVDVATSNRRIKGLSNFGQLAKMQQLSAEHLTDFDPPKHSLAVCFEPRACSRPHAARRLPSDRP